MLHVVNGDATLKLLRRTLLKGEFLVWRDMLMEGPAPNGLSTPEAWDVRASALEAKYGISGERYLAEMEQIAQGLAEAARHDEVVLWFEEDLFCHLHLLDVLRRLSRLDLPSTRLSLICPREPLGTRDPYTLAGLLAHRVSVSEARIALAQRAFDAYAASTPEPLARLVHDGDFAAWPLLRETLLAHLARYPHPRDGLGFLERETLRALSAGGSLPFGDLFGRVTRHGAGALYGIGDLQFALLLTEMSRGANPLLTLGASRPPMQPRPLAQTDFTEWHADITEAGRAVLTLHEDAVRLRGLDRWLGGVHLAGHGPLWRWDPEGARLLTG